MKKVRAVQTKDYIADAIRNEILAGHMEPGEELTQETLAGMLGVSRMPVREALQLLEQEGFIERLPNRHMVVAQVEGHKLEEIMGMAAAVETEIALCLCGKPFFRGIAGTEAAPEDTKSAGSACGRVHGDGGGPAKKLELMSQALRAGQTEQAAKWELEYHESLAAMLDNPYIEQMFQKLLGGYVAYMILKMEHDLEESYRLLARAQKSMEDGKQEVLHECLRQYYRSLFDCWNRKGQL